MTADKAWLQLLDMGSRLVKLLKRNIRQTNKMVSSVRLDDGVSEYWAYFPISSSKCATQDPIVRVMGIAATGSSDFCDHAMLKINHIAWIPHEEAGFTGDKP
ncbi:hypothetical protein HNY73_005916 [Argiope bruennichi]|uniref:Uncharacterized protein n=1 Tax=Argiope bruennichi TaxID=94029 RepID=A0A8T0FL81_ARGBR|nr:hypothetical protein HNY73_005916 [Argiope bruennichi]